MKKSKSLLIFTLLLFQISYVRAEGESPEASPAPAAESVAAAGATKDLVMKGIQSNPGLHSQVETSLKTCKDDVGTAHTYCLSSNPALQKYSGMIGVLMSGIAMAKSMSDACNDYGKALKLAELGLTAYNGMCSSAQMSCETSCSETRSTMESALGQLNAQLTAAQTANPSQANIITSDIQNVQIAQAAVQKQIAVCRKYKMNLAAAGAGLMNIVKTAAVAKSCENKTTTANCSTNPGAPGCAQSVDCSKKENESVPECVCQRMPNNPGCPGAVGDSGLPATARGSGYTGPSADAVNDKFNPDLSKSSDGFTPHGSVGSSGSSGMNPFGSSGGGAGNMGGSDGGTAKGTDSKSQKGMNTNILSGYEGGGGGGGARGGSSRDAMNSAYRAYMPGGEKDPTRGLASKTFGNGEVTAAGSKSNWEKVSERYKDNKPTLVGP